MFLVNELIDPPRTQALNGYWRLRHGLPSAFAPEVFLTHEVDVRHQVDIDIVVVKGSVLD